MTEAAGLRITADVDPSGFVNQLVVHRLSNGQKRVIASASEQVALVFKDSVSPDGKWLVVQAQDQSFRICPTEHLWAALETVAPLSPSFRTLKGEGSTSPAHFFHGWSGPHTLSIELGLNGEDQKIEFDLEGPARVKAGSFSVVFSAPVKAH